MVFTKKCIGVFRTQPNIYDRAFCKKKLTTKSRYLVLQSSPSKMLNRVLNMPLGKARGLTYETENGNLHTRFEKHLFPRQQNMRLTHFSIVKYCIFQICN